MKNLIRFIFLACMLISFTPASAQRALAAPVRKTVLVLFPLEFTLPGYPTYVLSMQAIQSEFGQAADLNLDVYVEYLDLSRFPGEAYQQQLLSLYAVKYGQKPIDLVLVSNEMALTWWLKYRATIAPSAPVVFYDVATDRLPALQLPPDVTGVTGMADYVPTVNWVRRALPAVKEIVLVYGVGQADQGQGVLLPVQALQAALRGQIEFTDLSNLPLAEIKQRVAALPQTSIVLYSAMFEDAARAKYHPFDVAREVAAASSVPIISGYDHLIGTGTVGGYMYSIEQQARDAARMGLRLLRGEAVSALPVVSNQSNRFVFDHLALQRFGIPLSALPPDSIVKNRQYSLWERYQPEIIAAGAAFVVLLLLVVFLLVVTRQLKQSEANLRQSEAKYRSIFDNASEGIYQSTSQGRFLSVNPAMVKLFGYASAEDMIHSVTDIGQQIYAHPGDREKILERLTQDGRAENYEVEWLRGDGQSIWVSLNTHAVRATDGAILYYEGAALDITERKRAEDELQRSQANLSALIESTDDLIWSVDLNYRLVTFNSNLQQLVECSYGTEAHVGDAPADFLPPERAVCWPPLYARALIEGPYQLEDGAPDGRTLELHFHPVVRDRHPVGVSVFGKDITERKRAEDELRRINTLMNMMVENIPNMVFLKDARELRFVQFNRAGEDLLGYSRGDLLGKNDYDFFPKEQADFFTEKDREVLRGIGVVEVPEEPLQTRNKGTRILHTKKAPLLDANGIPEYLLGISEDITERKRAEEALKESEARYRFISENTADVIWTLNPKTGKFTYVSASVQKLRGYTPEEVMIQTMAEALTPESLQTVVHSMQQGMERRKSGDTRPYKSISLLDQPCKDGSVVSTEVATTLVLDEQGQPVEVIGVTRDITERKKAEAEIRKLNADLEQRVQQRTAELQVLNKELEAFSYSVSHDLRAPLRAIDGYARILEEQYLENLPPDGARLLNSVRANASQMGLLIDSLLQLSKLGRQELNTQTIQPILLVQQALGTLTHEQEGRQVEMVIGELPACKGDPTLLLQVWVNLLSNAFKYTRKREVARVELGCQVNKTGEKIYYVKDNGVGFDMRYADKLFGVFQRLHSENEFEGTGVGLALVQRIIQRHGGSVWADSQPGVGTAFYFSLP